MCIDSRTANKITIMFDFLFFVLMIFWTNYMEHYLLKNWSLKRLPSNLYEARRWKEDGLQTKEWPLWMDGHAIWPFLCTQYSIHPINRVLNCFNGEFVVIHFDDILVYSKNKKQHLVHLCQVFKTLQEQKLCGNLKVPILLRQSCLSRLCYL